MAFVREMMDHPRGTTEEFWQSIAGLGWTGLIHGEGLGGAGLGLVDLCVLMEECGRALMPGPFFSTIAGALAVTVGARAEQREKLVPAIAAGTGRVALAQLEDSGSWGRDGITLGLQPEGDGFRLSGAKRFVGGAQSADTVVVAACAGDDDRIVLVLVDTDAAGVRVEPTDYTDATRKLATVHLDGVVIEPDAILGAPDAEAWPVLERVNDFAKVALCAEMIGGAQAVLDLSVEYAKTREQFGSPIGKFQAIQHKCSNMLVLVESAKSAAYYAAWAIENAEPDAHVSACMAKAYCAEAFSRVAADGIQIHGGMGFTWEADLHLYYKRAKAAELAFGSPAFNREQAAKHLLDG